MMTIRDRLEAARNNPNPSIMLIRDAADEIERLRSTIKWMGDLAGEELPHAKVGTGAEIVLRHIVRRVGEAL